MRVLAIDPGPEQSAWLIYDGEQPREFGFHENDVLCDSFAGSTCHMAIEGIQSFGMPVGAEVFETAEWIGRFRERWEGLSTKVYRKDVKLHLCQNPRAKDANIRQALIDKFGGKEKAIGKKSTPGPLWGIKRDLWSALAIAVTWWETRENEHGS